VWVADVDEVVVGWVALVGNRVVGLYVDPPHACRGFGSRLLAHAERALEAEGAPTVTLEASRNAEEFYLRRGYEASADRAADGARPMRKTLGSGLSSTSDGTGPRS
jgi:GNAT superfamily N-acetyltransferase